MKLTSFSLPSNVSRNGALYDIGMSIDIVTSVPNEIVLASLTGLFTHAATHTSQWRWYVDGVVYDPACFTSVALTGGYAGSWNTFSPLLIPSPGNHVIAMWVYSDNTTVWYAGSRLDIFQFPQ